MPHPPNKDSIKGLLPADFDCTQQPLPDKLKVLLCLLDGVERRQRLQTKFESPCPQQFVEVKPDAFKKYCSDTSSKPTRHTLH